MSRGSTSSAQPADVLPFAEVYLLYHDRVYRHCLVYLRGDAAAEDVTGDVFTAALAAYDRVRPHRDGVLFWLLRIAKNRSVSYLRQQQQFRRALGRLAGRREPQHDIEDEVAKREAGRLLATAMTQLSEADRRLIGLRVGREMSYRQIAGMLGMSQDEAEWATRRALRRAQVAYEALERVDPTDVRTPGRAQSDQRSRNLQGRARYPMGTLE